MNPAIFQKFINMFNLLSLSPGGGMQAVVEHRNGKLADLMSVTDSVTGEIAVCTDFDCLIYYSGLNTLYFDRFIIPSSGSLFDVKYTLNSNLNAIQNTPLKIVDWNNAQSFITDYPAGEIVFPSFKTDNLALGITGNNYFDYNLHLELSGLSVGATVTATIKLEDTYFTAEARAQEPDMNVTGVDDTKSVFTGIADSNGDLILDGFISRIDESIVSYKYDRVQVYVEQDGVNTGSMLGGVSTLAIFLPMYTRERTLAW